MAFPDAFATERLRAERLRQDHFADILLMHQDPVQMAWLGGLRDEAATRAYVADNLRHWDEHGFGLWLLREADGGRVAGRALLRHLLIDEADEVEVGYSFYQEFWGRGLATEIAGACLDHGRRHLGLDSIVALARTEHVRSQRVMAKLGMIFERHVVRDGMPHVLFRTTGQST
jgi:RimJ/RimL family protein N-acetyltransferase